MRVVEEVGRDHQTAEGGQCDDLLGLETLAQPTEKLVRYTVRIPLQAAARRRRSFAPNRPTAMTQDLRPNRSNAGGRRSSRSGNLYPPRWRVRRASWCVRPGKEGPPRRLYHVMSARSATGERASVRFMLVVRPCAATMLSRTARPAESASVSSSGGTRATTLNSAQRGFQYESLRAIIARVSATVQRRGCRSGRGQFPARSSRSLPTSQDELYS